MNVMPLKTVPAWTPEKASPLEAYEGRISWISWEASRGEFPEEAMSAERWLRFGWQARGHQRTYRHTISSAESLLQNERQISSIGFMHRSLDPYSFLVVLVESLMQLPDSDGQIRPEVPDTTAQRGRQTTNYLRKSAHCNVKRKTYY